MREIKFKIWDKDEQKFTNLVGDDRISDLNDYFTFLEYIYCQYIGEEDKNKKEIYEGDIVKDNQNIMYTVVFDKGRFRLHVIGEMPRFAGNYEHIIFSWQELEIVGNEFENPECFH